MSSQLSKFENTIFQKEEKMNTSEYIFPDRCAFDEGKKRCRALNKKECQGCTFFKTEEELAAGREKAGERIKSLGVDEQIAIDKIYHRVVIR